MQATGHGVTKSCARLNDFTSLELVEKNNLENNYHHHLLLLLSRFSHV